MLTHNTECLTIVVRGQKWSEILLLFSSLEWRWPIGRCDPLYVWCFLRTIICYRLCHGVGLRGRRRRRARQDDGDNHEDHDREKCPPTQLPTHVPFLFVGARAGFSAQESERHHAPDNGHEDGNQQSHLCFVVCGCDKSEMVLRSGWFTGCVSCHPWQIQGLGTGGWSPDAAGSAPGCR